MIKRDVFLAFLLIIVAIGFLFPHLGEFVYPFGSGYSDLVISHYPNLEFLKNSIRSHHQVPLWSNTILSGYPFTANPLSGVWYLPTWLAVILPSPWGINLLVLLHLVFGGVGLYKFQKRQGLGFWPAALSALSFPLMPKLFSHYAAGHITLVFAVSWTPWLFLAEINREKCLGGNIKSILPGIILGLIFLADPRWTVYAGGFWFFYSAYLHFFEDHPRVSDKNIAATDVIYHDKGWLPKAGAQVLVALWVALPLLMPLFQYSSLSTRDLMTPTDNLTLSLEIFRLLGLVVPDMAGYAEHMIYFGSVSMVFFVWTVIHPRARASNRFWIIVFFLSVFYSLGENVPFISFLATLPGMRLLRVPSRALFLAGFCLSIMLGNSTDLLLQKKKNNPENNPLANMLLVGLAGLMVVLSTGIWVLSGEFPVEFVWGGIAITLAVVLTILYTKRNISDWIFVCGLVLVLCLDQGGVNISQMDFRSSTEVVGERRDVINAITGEEDPYRIYSPSYSIPQHAAVLKGLELADGIDPLQLSSYVCFMEDATGVPMNSYSVTLPPFSTGKPMIDNQFYKPDLQKLGLLNVRYIVAEYPISQDDLILRENFGNSWLYENPAVFPRAWIQPTENEHNGEEIRSVEIVERTPNRISVQVKGPGRLVLSEINYPGWKLRVDEQAKQLDAYMGLLRSVNLDSGAGIVVFEFKPLVVYLGVIFSLLTFLGGITLKRRHCNVG